MSNEPVIISTLSFNLLSEPKYAITSFVALIKPTVVGVDVPTPSAPDTCVVAVCNTIVPDKFCSVNVSLGLIICVLLPLAINSM